MMSMRGNRHRKAQHTGLLRTASIASVPFDYLNSAGRQNTELFENRHLLGTGLFQFPSLSTSLNKMSNNKRKAPQSTAEVGFLDTSFPDIEGVNLDDELLDALKNPLVDVSRQRLRAIQISFRRLGNLENQITAKELNSVLLDHNIKMPGRTFQLILKKFEGKYGVDFEPLWKFMVQAQSRTGRDSVIANNRSTNGLSDGQSGFAKEDYDLIVKLYKAMKGSQYDLAALRLVLQENDDSDHGVIPRKKIRALFVDQHVPIPGPLLNTLLKRCDDEKDGMINWACCVTLLDHAIKFDPEKYEKQNKAKKYKPLSPTNKSDSSEETEATTSPGTSKAPQTGKKKVTGGKDTTGDKKTGDKEKKSQDPKAKAPSKEAMKADLAKSKPQRPGTASSSRPKSGTTSRPGTAKSGRTEDKDKQTATQKKDGSGADKMNKSASKSGIRSSAELNESGSSKGSSSSAKCTDSSGTQKVPSTGKTSGENKQSNSNETAKDKKEPQNTYAKKYSKSTLGGISSLSKGLALASDDMDKEYLKQAQEQINAPSNKDRKPAMKIDSKVKGDVKTDAKVKGESKNDPKVNAKSYGSAGLSKMSAAYGVSDAKKDNKQKVENNPRPVTAQVTTRPMTAKAAPMRPATSKVTRPMTARSEGGRVSGRKVPPIGLRKNSVAPENQNFPGKTHHKWNRTGAKDSSNIDKYPALDSSQDSSVKSSSGSKSPDIKGDIQLHNSSSNSLQSTSSSQASNASDQPLLSSKETNAKDSLKSSVKDKQDKESHEDGKLFKSFSKSFKGFLGMKNAKDDPEEDKKKLLEIESLSNNSQEGIELRSAAELLDETCESETKQDEASADKSKPEEKLKPEEPPATNAELVDFVLHGKQVSYYKPDEYVGQTLCGDAPKETLQLDWVYGYRGNDCRCNMYVLQSGELVYFMARIAILYNGVNHAQRHYMEHTADIKCLAVHPNQVTVATGQSAGSNGPFVKACIRIWQSDSLETLHVIGDNDFEKTVISISFASNVNHLVAVDGSDGHTMSIWDTESGKKLADKQIATEVVCQVVFHPKRNEELITIGKEHMVFWKCSGEPLMIQEFSQADYQTNMKAKYIICLAFKSNGDLVTGDSNGTVYVWGNGGNTICQTIRHAHEGPVFSLLYLKGTLLTGGRDGLIQAWKFSGSNGEQTGKFEIPSTEGGVRMLQTKANMLYIGTTLNCILTATLNQSGPVLTDAKLNDKPITRGHYDDIYNVVSHTSLDQTAQFITAGFDGTLMLFDADSHTTLWKHTKKGTSIQCVDINPKGSLIALGTKDSSLIILSIDNKNEISEVCSVKIDKAPITCVKFSPDDECVAIGGSDSIISIMRITNEGKNYQPIGKCKGLTGAITGLDWSIGNEKAELGCVLRSSTSTIEHSLWNVTLCKQVEDVMAYRNTTWTSHNALTGFHVAGAWGSLTDNATITSVDRSRNQHLLCTGDNTGDVMLYSYPCCKPLAASNTVTAHSTETSCVRFTADNKYVLSTGGTDCTVMQWKVV